MQSFNAKEMYNEAEEAVSDKKEFAPTLTAAELPEGTEVLVKVKRSTAQWREAKTDKNKGPAQTFQNILQVLEGDHKGGEFFDSLHFSGGDLNGELTDTQKSYNKRLFSKLKGAGLDAAFFNADPSAEAIAKALEGRTFTVKVRWQDNGFLDNTTSWSQAAPTGFVPKAEPNRKGF